MQIVIRTYHGKGTRKLFDLLEAHQADVQALMSSIKGLISYTLARNDEGGFSVTICRDNHGIKKSVKLAREFIAQHSPDTNLAAMHIFEGKVITHFK